MIKVSVYSFLYTLYKGFVDLILELFKLLLYTWLSKEDSYRAIFYINISIVVLGIILSDKILVPIKVLIFFLF